MEVKETILKFGEEVKSSAGRIAKGAIDGSKKLAEKTKIRNSIGRAESKLNAAYLQAGRKYEELYAENADPEFAEYLAEIADAKARIARLRADLAALDKAVVCPGCGKFVQLEDGRQFCPFCGTKQEKPAPAEEAVEAEIVAEEAADEAPEAADAADEDAPEADAE